MHVQKVVMFGLVNNTWSCNFLRKTNSPLLFLWNFFNFVKVFDA